MLVALEEKYPDISIVMMARVGSYAFNTLTDSSDTDLFGIFIQNYDKVYYNDKALVGVDEIDYIKILEEKSTIYKNVSYDVKLFNIVRFYKLIKFGNPDSITFLFSKEFMKMASCMQKLVDWRDNFITKEAVSAFLYYGASQIKNVKKDRKFDKKENSDRVLYHGYDTKAGSHAVRLIEQGKFMLDNGTCDPTYKSDLVMAIKRGEISKQDMIDYAENAEKEYRSEMESSTLPDRTPEEFRDILDTILSDHFRCKK